MKKGDLVRFRKNPHLAKIDECGMLRHEIGILIEYRKWEKIASILFNGEIVRVRGEYVSKAGKKDFIIDNITQ